MICASTTGWMVRCIKVREYRFPGIVISPAVSGYRLQFHNSYKYLNAMRNKRGTLKH
jgi:hypothetical protein